MSAPVITIEYREDGTASVDIDAGWSRRTDLRARWSTSHARIAPGTYDRSHVVGVHRGRVAIVQQGLTPLELTDGRRGWFGFNIHDPRGDLLGCVAPSPGWMLDALGILERCRVTHRDASLLHPQTGQPLVTVVVK